MNKESRETTKQLKLDSATQRKWYNMVWTRQCVYSRPSILFVPRQELPTPSLLRIAACVARQQSLVRRSRLFLS